MSSKLVIYAMVLLLAGLLLAPAAPASAFCIYNQTGAQVTVVQESGGRFSRGFKAKMGAESKACCNWKNKDCNKHGHKDSTLTFTVFKWVGAQEVELCHKVRIKAGGWLDIDWVEGNYRCTAHY
ncbi:MAG: hypothetical protein K9K66_18980 [Desulfarculaceae bacterium]|nr:hypothetical protein [Desulfarculaceae bacterium]MCF8073587.1 hypothetical protein [Desulfarculaceae bacterium]MCF8103744.1 hypothetical protein [Desulfarculaceae bacterium]MCF8115697.1 hypothetical protein [Desulfarculaceae bacterium]